MRTHPRHSADQGSALIELLVAIAIIAILAVIVFAALGAIIRFQDARNSRRWNDVSSYLTAIHECLVDNNGTEAACLGTLTDEDVYEIVSSGSSGCDDIYLCYLGYYGKSRYHPSFPVNIKINKYRLLRIPNPPSEDYLRSKQSPLVSFLSLED